MYFPGNFVLAGAITGLLGSGSVSASAISPLDLSARNGLPAVDPRMQAIRRALSDASLTERDTVFKNSTSISKSFDGATLFDASIDIEGPGSPGVSVSVVCNTCYVTGRATAELNVNGNFNASGNISSLAHTFASDVSNITSKILDDVTETLKNDTVDVLELDFADLQWPTIDADFDIAVQSIPECQLAFTFDNLELYLQTQTNVSGAATFTVNLFTSESDIGIRVSDGLELGIVLTVDLIMSIDAGIQVESGFHLKMDDGLSLNIDFFGNNVSDIIVNGGTFEFLPASIDAEGTINAILRVGVHTGVILASDTLEIEGISLANYSAGVETILFADVANLTTSFATSSNSSAGSDLGVDLGDCDLAAEEIYEFAIGAAAGASVVVGDFSWGVGPTKVLPIFYTTVAQCVKSVTASGTAKATATAAATTTGAVVRRTADPVRRANSVTTTISTTFTYSAVGCKSKGLINCPVSLQTTALTTSASTITTVVRSGEEATWPATTATTVNPVPFGTNAKSVALSVSGTPSSFTPSTSTPGSTAATGATASTTANILHPGSHLSTKQVHIIIGVTVGVGVPLLTVILAGVILFVRRRKDQPQLKHTVVEVASK